MGSIFARGSKLYAKVKAVDGTWKQLATGLAVGQESAAAAWLADLEGKVEAELAATGGEGGPLTFRRYAEAWLDKRATATVADDRTRLRLHAFPLLGDMLLDRIKPRHIRDLVLALKRAGELAPATIRQVSGLLHTVFKSAVIDELVVANPVQLARGVLPKKADRDPTWRHEAIYTRDEIEALISDERILDDRRVLYALKSLAALRHTEAATLAWSAYDQRAEPLGAINLGETKSGVPRRMPVHPTLAKVLAAWKLEGWERTYGRKPTSEDLIVPTRRLAARAAAESQKQLIADLDTLELRTRAGKDERRRQNRRGHDMRRTFITLARTDGASKDILRWCTHGPSAGDMMDVYSSFDWSALCAEVAKLKLELREGKLIELPIAVGAGAVVVQSTEAVVVAAERERPQRDSNPCYLRERRVS